ncbi:CAP domain-containing protein [Streptomyces himalayensis]|uniref:TerD family protein n=1 Tax=Streptomyces himalayensis subsp. himalayensis TaxID=2756131 RepID=A0A7W0DMS9_9ACTN|nr:CAP domain-containing protein [Streptomyces himalayensis]MBA2947966.1 TerD family protein [Streptomyces himalayensis subsp. himalayensis]
MSELVPGGNLPLPGGTLTIRVPGAFDMSAIITDDSGKVRGDGDFVFYNQPAAPGARLLGEELVVDPTALRAGASRVTVVISPAEPGTPLGHLPRPTLHVSAPGGRVIARFTPPRPQHETVLLLAEVYRRGPAWKLRALGQGYAEGLAGVARDFGVDVVEDAVPSPGGAVAGGSPRPVAPPGRDGSRMPSTAPGSLGFRLPGPRGLRLSGAFSRANGPRVPASGSSGSPVSGGAPDPDDYLRLVNSARARSGSPPVVLDARLTAAARDHAAGMAARGQLASKGPDGVSVHQRITASGYAYLTVGEHLVSGPRTPAEFVEYCLSAERSRSTLCEPAFTEAGLAYVADRRSGDMFWTALWARPFTPAGLAQTAAEVIALTNTERARAGLTPLSGDPHLTAAAQGHSADMVARAFYSHTSPDGSEPWDRAAAAGCTRRSIGENIACGQRSPAEVVDGWMNSPGHRANILKPGFTHIGVGFAGGGAAGTYWTQLFGG